MDTEQGELFADVTVERLTSSLKFARFFDELSFSLGAHIEATRALMEVATTHYPSIAGEQAHFHQRASIPNFAITFSKEDKIVPFFHKRPLYVTAVVHGHEFTRIFLDGPCHLELYVLLQFSTRV